MMFKINLVLKTTILIVTASFGGISRQLFTDSLVAVNLNTMKLLLLKKVFNIVYTHLKYFNGRYERVCCLDSTTRVNFKPLHVSKYSPTDTQVSCK